MTLSNLLNLHGPKWLERNSKTFTQTKQKYFSDSEDRNGQTSGTSKTPTIFAHTRCTNFSKQKADKTMASSNHQQRIGQYISLCSLELHNFKYWLNRQNPENIKASLISVIDHARYKWSPLPCDYQLVSQHLRPRHLPNPLSRHA